MSGDPCQQCDAKCCQYFCFEIDKPETFEEFDDIRWYVAHEDVSVHVEENGDWYISIMNRCKMLDRSDRCRIYEDRPLICRKYDPEKCDLIGGDYGYKAEFHTPEQLEAYAREVLGKKNYERAKAAAREKIAQKQAAKPAKKTRKKRKSA